MLPAKLDTWLQQNSLPPRLLLSGSGDLWPTAQQAAAELTGSDLGLLQQGLNADVRLCADEGSSLKIGEREHPDALSVRGLITWLNQKPVASHRVLVLENLERTSRDAMQAWLKVLEEPPPRAQFLLTTRNHHRLPETILSRVTVLSISTPMDLAPTPEAEKFLAEADLIAQFQLIDALDKAVKDEPQTVANFMHDLLALARQNPAHQHRLPALFMAHRDLEQNVNRRLVLENLALSWQKQ